MSTSSFLPFIYPSVELSTLRNDMPTSPFLPFIYPSVELSTLRNDMSPFPYLPQIYLSIPEEGELYPLHIYPNKDLSTYTVLFYPALCQAFYSSSMPNVVCIFFYKETDNVHCKATTTHVTCNKALKSALQNIHNTQFTHQPLDWTTVEQRVTPTKLSTQYTPCFISISQTHCTDQAHITSAQA